MYPFFLALSALSAWIVPQHITLSARKFTPPTYIVTVSGVPSDQGYVLVALYSRAEDFPKAEEADYTRKVPAHEGRVSVDFAELTPGSYAIAVFHDADSNGKITTNFLGMPQEAYGFGNDARGTFGPPSFESALVKFDGQRSVVVKIK